MVLDYTYDANEVLDLIKSIHETSDLTDRKGKAKLPVGNVGPSGQKFRTLISELNGLQGDDGCYLEVGIYRGRTIFTSAVENSHVKHIGIDNFSQFDPEGVNAGHVYGGIKELGLTNVEIVEDDFTRYFIGLGRIPERNVGMFFYDAIHDYRSQLYGLLQGARVITPGGLLIVDDTNYAHVRYATYDFIEAYPDYKLLFETYTYMHPARMEPEVAAAARDAWWNGTHVIIYDPENRYQGLGASRSEDTDIRFARAVTQTTANCPGLPTQFAKAS